MLSVLIPVYNEELTVAEVLRRVLALGSILTEVVVDDGSTDRTAAVVQSLQRYEPRIRLHRLEYNSGKTAAIRRALHEATGDVITVQDTDLAAR